MLKSNKGAMTALVFFSLVFALATGSLAQGVQRMAKEELESILDEPGLVIIDVRTQNSWEASGEKIQGARREDPRKVQEWADEYERDEKIVLYCA